MSDQNFGCQFDAAGSGNENVQLWAANVQDEFVGISLTERQGFTMRRVCAEVHQIDDIKKLRDVLSAFIDRKENK